jgi:hypothetical protein
MIQLFYAQLHLDQVLAEGNFADRNAHGISLITSKLEIHDSHISNHQNTIGVTEEEANRAHSGFIYMTYGSILQINNTSVEHINAQRVGLLYAAE